MSEKRKRIFKDALFVFPFMLIVSAVALGMMFTIGRTPRDMAGILKRNFTSNQSMKIDDYSKYNTKKYNIDYYYGDSESCVKYAEYSYNAKGDDPLQTLKLFEARDGFDPGIYKIEWFHMEEYVTYSTLENENEVELYKTEEVPLMHNLVESYSWESQMEMYETEVQPSKGYKVLGLLTVYTWESTDRQNILWGLGGNPKELYSYINNSVSEYKKISLNN